MESGPVPLLRFSPAGWRTSRPSTTLASSDGRAQGVGMAYFVTGATGFIGRFLVAELLKREGT
ncbi:MAG TPA: SDR family oxidoreductase, partial [Jatrophihabitantaceae bacterium]